jgi:O-antigen/teichoic acid export membrane protein
MSVLDETVQKTRSRTLVFESLTARAACLGIHRGSVVTNAASLFGTTVVTSGLGFVFWIVAAHMFSRSAVGAGGAALSAMQLIANAGMLGLGTLLIGELSRGVEHPARLIATALCVSASAGIAGGVGVAVGVRALSSSGMIPNGIVGLALFAATAAVYAALLVLDDTTVGLSRASWQLWRNGVFSVVKLALLPVVALALGLGGSAGLLLSWLGGAVLSILVIKVLAGRANLRLVARPQRTFIGSYGGTALLHHWLNLSSGAPILVLPMIVAAYLTPAANGPFYSALLLVGFAYIVSTHFGTALFGIASGDHGALERELRRTIKVCLAVGAGALVVFGAGGHLLLSMFGSGYAEASLPLAILGVGTFPGSVRSQYTAVCRVNGDLRRCALLNCLGSGMQILLPFAALASGGGLVLASCSWVAAMFLESALMWPAVASVAGLPGRSSLLTRCVAPRTFALACAKSSQAELESVNSTGSEVDAT